MKRFAIILTLFFGSGLVSAQTTESVINDIRTKYQHIRKNLDSYDTTMVDIWDESTEGGQGTAFYDGNEIKLIEVIWLGETGKRKIEYYFDQGELFFAFNTDYRYNRPIFWDEKIAKENGDTEAFDAKKTKTVENRYYFDNGKLTRWLDNQKDEINVDSVEYSDKGRELIAHANRMKEQLKK